MPELPEVQTIVDFLNDKYTNKEIKDVYVLDKVLHKQYDKFISLKNQTIHKIERKAKYLIWYFSNNLIGVNHLAMTGIWLRPSDLNIIPKHARLSFVFDNDILYFVDVRKWGKFTLFTQEEFDKILNEKLSKLGPDSLNDEITIDYLIDYFKKEKIRKMEIKPLLMEQSFISGLGNIYAAEVCYLAGINPFKKVYELTDKQIISLQKAIHPIIENAYKNGGSSVKNYIHPDGIDGTAQLYHIVYGKKECKVCHHTIIKQKQNGRSTYWCPFCQR